MRSVLAGVAVTALVVGAGLGLLRGPAGAESADAAATGPSVVLVSGRDDHGLVELEAVPLLAGPALEGDGEVVASVADGTLVRVLGGDGGSWVEVATLDDSAAGWIDDHRLRGAAHVVGAAPGCPTALHGSAAGPVLAQLRPSEQVEVLDQHTDRAGEVWVGVRTVQRDLVGLVPGDRLAQLPGPAPRSGTPCERVEPDPEAQPHQH